MAAALRKVSLDYHQTLGRVQATSGVPLWQHRDKAVVPFRVPETPSNRNTLPSRAVPSSVSLFSPSLVYILLNYVPLVGGGHCSRGGSQRLLLALLI